MKPERSTGHIPRKRFGQNFLQKQIVIDDILRVIRPCRDDHMIEIGPGQGALTTPLAAALDTLHVIEIDRDLITQLRGRYAGGNVVIHEGDALAFDFAALARQLHAPMRVVGNLPYNISTPLLFHLATQAQALRDIHVMLQKEVVERMVAVPDTSNYSRLSVMLQYRFDMELVLEVEPEAFYPQPKVNSAVVRMSPRAAIEPAAIDEPLFARVVTAAFSQRRKTLRNTLKSLVNEDGYNVLGIDPGARAQELSVADFVHIANWLQQPAR